MRKTLIILACSTMLLTACSSKKADNTKSVVEQTTTTPDKPSNTNDVEDSKIDTASVTSDQTVTTPSEDNKNSDIANKVVEYIMNGQNDKPAADQILWSKTFLDKVDLEGQYQKYLSDGGVEGDVEKFAAYITEHAPIADDWQEMFKADLKDTYGTEVTKLEDLGDNMYQAYIMYEEKEVPYVVVNARTGYFHG